jgi:hypothetical protein
MVAGAGRAVWRYIRRSPGTFIWLAILFVTTQIIRHADPAFAYGILEKRSTNIHYLNEQPVRVLIRSALWIDGSWFFYFILYNIFHATAERWLGTWRWLAVLTLAHVIATYASEGVLLWAINHGHAQESMRFTLDYGVSYALAGIVAVLTYWLATPWRYLYCAGVLIVYGWPLIHGRTFTDLGHFTAVLIGLACYPIVRSKGTGLFDPVVAARQLFARAHRVA